MAGGKSSGAEAPAAQRRRHAGAVGEGVARVQVLLLLSVLLNVARLQVTIRTYHHTHLCVAFVAVADSVKNHVSDIKKQSFNGRFISCSSRWPLNAARYGASRGHWPAVSTKTGRSNPKKFKWKTAE